MQLLMEERTSLTEFFLLIFLCYNKNWETAGGEKTTKEIGQVWKRLSPVSATQRVGVCVWGGVMGEFVYHVVV